MKTIKKALSVILAICLLLSTFSLSFNVAALSAEDILDIEFQPITLIEDYDASTRWDSEAEASFDYYEYRYSQLRYTVHLADGSSFTDSYYYFYYDGEEYQFDLTDNQSFDNEWTAGNTYYVTASVLGITKSIPITIVENPISSIDIQSLEIIENTNGHIEYREYDEYGVGYDPYYRYNPSCLYGTIYFTDGSYYELTGDSGFYYNDKWRQINLVTDQSYENQWTVGNTYTAQVEALGVRTDVEVSIVGNPISSIEIEPLYILKNTNGFLTEDSCQGETLSEEYYHYSPDSFNGTVYFNDGSYYEIYNDNGFYYKDQWYGFSFGSDQSYNNQWTSGNKYTATLRAMNFETEVEINILDTYVKNISISPKTVLENSNGYYEQTELGEYYCYDIRNFDYEIEMLDGTIVTSEEHSTGGFSYEGEWYYFYFMSDQSYDNQWTAGNTYTAEVEICGATADVEISIESSPVSRVEMKPIDIIEGTCSHNEEGYDHYDLDYLSYNKYQYTVYYKNGSSETSSGRDFYYDGESYYLSFTTDQSYENQWTVGNTYTATGSLLGAEFEVEVNIVPTPIKSLTIEPIYVEQFTSGNNNDGWVDGEYIGSYFHYEINRFTYNVEYNDGSKDNGINCYDLYYDDDWYSFTFISDQSYENQWTAGNTYTATVRVLGYDAEVEVIIVESLIESIEIDPIEIIEETNGYRNENNDGYIYNPSKFSYEIKLLSGQVLKGYNYYVEYYYDDSYTHWFEFSSDQSDNNQWTVGNTYTAQVSILGRTIDVPVTIIENPYESVEILQVKPVVTTDGGIDENGNAVYIVPDFSFKLNKKDGGFDRHSVYGIVYGGDNCALDIDVISTSQDETPWTVGGENKATVAFGTLTAEFIVPMVHGEEFEYIEEDEQVFITGINMPHNEITIPSTINNKPVVGLLDLGDASWRYNLTTLNLPDSLVYISDIYCDTLEVVNLGKNAANITENTFRSCYSLLEINAPTNSLNYTTIDGMLYDKKVETLIAFPSGKTGDYYVPDSVKNIDCVLNHDQLNPIFGENNSIYTTIDGVTYSSDMTRIVSCDPEKTGEYIMPDTVTEIAQEAFYGSNLSSITFSNKVTDILYYSFADCSNLETVVLPENLQTIGQQAFAFSNLKNLTELPRSVKTIYSSFENTGIKSMTLHAGIESYEGAFSGSSLEEITLEEGITVIDNRAFAGTQIKEINLPSSVTVIGNGSFNGTQITEIDLKNVTTIGSSAFSNTSLESVTFPDSVTNLGSSAFDNTPIKTLTIGKGISEIPSYAFSRTQIKDLVLPAHIEVIHAGAFEGSLIETITFENKTVKIGDYAFAYCDNLKSLILGDGEKVTGDGMEIGEGAFQCCPLVDLTLLDNVTRIEKFAFTATDIESVTIPNSVTELTYHSFSCSQLETIDLPDSIEFVDGYTFDGTAWYKSQPNGQVYLENVLYYYKGTVEEETDIVVKNGTTVIADYAFEHSNNGNSGSLIKSISLPESLITIGKGAFYRLDSIESIYIPKNVKNIGEHAFACCFNLNELVVDPDNPYFTSEDNVLYNKDKTELILCLKKDGGVFTVPDTVETIRNDAFALADVEYIEILNDDIELEETSLSTKYTQDSMQYYGCIAQSVVGIICNENSNAYLYGIENLAEVVTIKKIEVNNKPNKTTYKQGEAFDAEGLDLLVTFNNNQTTVVNSGFTVSELDSSTSGIKYIDIEYNGFTTKLAVVVEATASVSNKTVQPGETVDVFVSLDNNTNISSISVSGITYDTESLELIGAEWLLNNTLMSDWDDNFIGVANFKNNTNISGNICKLTFKAKEEIEEKDVTVNCNVIINGLISDSLDTRIPVTVTPGTVSIKNYTPGDISGDNVLNDRDAIYLLYATFNPELYPVNQDCDFDGNGVVNDRDAIHLLYHTFAPDRYPLH